MKFGEFKNLINTLNFSDETEVVFEEEKSAPAHGGWDHWKEYQPIIDVEKKSYTKQCLVAREGIGRIYVDVHVPYITFKVANEFRIPLPETIKEELNQKGIKKIPDSVSVYSNY